MSIQLQAFLRGFAALTLAAAAAQAQAGGPAAEQLSRMAPRQRVEAIRALAAQQAASRTAKAGHLDTTPPTVTAFDAATRVDASKSIEQLKISLTATDDLSGVDSIMLAAVSPSGQRVYAYSNGHAGMLQVKAGLALTLSPFSEPGLWRIESVNVSDLNNNWTSLGQDALKLLGNTEFQVLSKSSDLVAPTLTSGKILTPEVSLSVPAKGTENQPSAAKVLLNTSDTGTDAVSGPSNSWPSFCLRDHSVCIYFGSYGQSVYGIKKFAEVVANPYLSDAPLGEYVLETVGVSDWAGNYRLYTSTEFGGETDFSTLFPFGTVLTIKP